MIARVYGSTGSGVIGGVLSRLLRRSRPSLSDPACRRRVLARLRELRPDTPRPRPNVSRPGEWSADVDRLLSLVERFAARDPAADWPDHALFGAMTGADWGVFCHKHFDHHLRQFGV